MESARYLSVFAIGADSTLNFFAALMSAISRGGRSGDTSASPFSTRARRVPAAATLRNIARWNFGGLPPFQPSKRASTTCSLDLNDFTLKAPDPAQLFLVHSSAQGSEAVAFFLHSSLL